MSQPLSQRLPYFIGPPAVLLLGILSGTSSGPGEWYAGLQKPWFTPPSWAFGPVWTVLYLTIGWVGARKWLYGGRRGLWAFQMLLNFAWSPIFFGAQAPVPALGVIGAMWLTIAAFIGLEWKADPLSARLFLPYLLWVSIATSLNLAIVVLN